MSSKWMAVLEDKHKQFIKDVLKKTRVNGTKTNGSLVIREALNRVMQDSGDFISSLNTVKLQERLEALNKRRKQLEDEENRIKAALKP